MAIILLSGGENETDLMQIMEDIDSHQSINNLSPMDEKKFIDIIAKKRLFEKLIAHDFSKHGSDLWQPYPSRTPEYTGLYALLHNKNAVTFQLYAYKTSDKDEPYIYVNINHLFFDKNFDYIYYFSGNNHASILLPFPLTRHAVSANPNFFTTWYSKTKNDVGSLIQRMPYKSSAALYQ